MIRQFHNRAVVYGLFVIVAGGMAYALIAADRLNSKHWQQQMVDVQHRMLDNQNAAKGDRQILVQRAGETHQNNLMLQALMRHAGLSIPTTWPATKP
jgi:hypothetical protein